MDSSYRAISPVQFDLEPITFDVIVSFPDLPFDSGSFEAPACPPAPEHELVILATADAANF